MYKVKLLDKISNLGLNKFGDKYVYSREMNDEDCILVRSKSLHECEFNSNLLAIARAGSGVNNIPLDECTEKGIVVFNTPGANANAVKELVICSLFMASRKIVESIKYVDKMDINDNIQKQAELIKKQFAGPEIAGKKLGVIGLGAIGIKVANAAVDLEMDVLGYDPYISVDNAWTINKKIEAVKNINRIFSECDYITLHVPANGNTKNMVNKDMLNMCKNNVKIINFSRDSLVNNHDIKDGLLSGKVGKYISDFIVKELLGLEGVIFLPHLGASTYESEDNCALMAVNELKEYLENGNIINSVNFPGCYQIRKSKYRICIINNNVPSVISKISIIFSTHGLNIENMVNRSNGNIAYTLVDTNDCLSKDIVNEFNSLPDIVRFRVIH